MEFSLRKQCKLLAVNYFLKKVQSQMFGIVLNTPLSYYDSLCYYNADDNTSLPISRDPSKVVNGQHKSEAANGGVP